MHNGILILAIFAFLYSIVAGRIERGMVSGPIVFVSAGILMGPLVLGWFEGGALRQQLRIFADMTLVLILFSDAANVELSVLRSKIKIPTRMLLVGLPGVIVLGFGLALVLLDMLSLYEAAILGVILAATDAALGKAVISDPRVPDWIRASLNAESGLNDGICVPFLFIFIALSLETAGTAASTVAPLIIVLEEIGIGLIAGLGLTLVAGTLLKFCISRGWLTEVWTQVTVPALALACFELAGEMHGSGYIAAFTGGLLFGRLMGPAKHKFVLAAEGIGETLAMLTWLLFGSAVVASIIGLVTWQIMAYALLSLTVVRVLPIFLSLSGTASTKQDRLFLGWFGPRGLASIVFVIIVMDSELPGGEVIALVVVLTVFLSLIIHGITARPLSGWISRHHSGKAD
ncbi:cation:proton antiporter [Parasedimentitalea psychrophila]|uniref:Cation:proton antiporter n=1 Tax=Parasedimentitalea psychrophila TaxID=2997337 RepID=A0A9Y2L178_9RHOB|nr:cation:proton antiporter [Parasedimentitalea psychrophila]WIY25677.1 cation:proton antiporter [Parasedimentitalea psychrophila]